jgi:predicted metal-dependent HD superfamily phosphohydrolase
MFRRHIFHASLKGVGAKLDLDAFDDLAAAYAEPGRYYHTQQHISACLAHCQRFRALAQRPSEVEVALWFHDAVYDSHRSDNEEQSAQWAERYLAAAAVAPAVISRIVEMILATKFHAEREGDIALVVDIDLGILGAAVQAFETYDHAIRREYDWVPEAQYRAARCQILQTFLDREAIYQTQTFRRHYEAQARENLSRKITELGI